MTGWGYFGTAFSLLFVTLVTTIIFAYVWLRSHGPAHMTHFHQAHVDAMAGDEGED